MQCCSSLWWKWAFNELPHVKNEDSLLASVFFEDFPIFGWHAQKVKTKFHPQEGSAFLRALFLKMLPPPTTSHKKDHFFRAFKSCCGISTHIERIFCKTARTGSIPTAASNISDIVPYMLLVLHVSYVTLMCVFLPFPVISYQTFPKIKIPSPFSLHEIFPVRECWWFCVPDKEKKSEGSCFISVS